MARDCSVIFIGNESTHYQRNNFSKSRFTRLLFHFLVPPNELPQRIVASLIPPIIGNCIIYVDLLGPSLALLFMAALLHYGHALKLPSAAITSSPTQILLIYACLMPSLTYFISKVGKSKIAFLETVSLLGYSMFGHVFTLCLSLLCYQETSNVFFFICFLIFGGLSALRVVFVLLASIPLPAARLMVCSLVATLHLLFLVFIHFTYMHRTFVYGTNHRL